MLNDPSFDISLYELFYERKPVEFISIAEKDAIEGEILDLMDLIGTLMMEMFGRILKLVSILVIKILIFRYLGMHMNIRW